MTAVSLRSQPQTPEPRFDLRDLFQTLVRARLRIGLATVLAGLVGLGIAFALPKWYRATAAILPPEESDLLQNLSLAQRALSKFPAFGALPDYFTPADIFKAILQSESVREDVANRFDLKSVYRLKSREKTLKALKDHSRVKLNVDGTIVVEVEDRDPKRAAAMANAFFEALDRYNVVKRNSQARRTREFLVGRVRETDSLLRVSETALRQYQESRHTIAPTALQSAGDTQAAADLMARKIALEVRLGVLRSYLQDSNEQVVQTEAELDNLKSRIASLPAIQDELQRLIREERIQEQLYVLLTSELEQARVRETMNTPTVQMLDPAVPPERASRPRKLALAGGAALIAFLVSTGWVFLREGPRRSESE